MTDANAGSPAKRILARAHSPSSVARIHAQKIQYKPLQLLTAGPNVLSSKTNPVDGRAARRRRRLAVQESRKSRKPQPLSAAQKRRLCVHDIPKSEVRYEVYQGLHRLWCEYMRDVLGLDKRKIFVTAQSAGQNLASADYHGAEVEVVRSRCISRVGCKGIVVRDSKFMFVVVTKQNQLKHIPKEHTIFRFSVPLTDPDPVTTNENEEEGSNDQQKQVQPLEFEIHGSRLRTRAADRTNKKFKMHADPDL
ncbi:MAG: hypothetical protein M1828_004619 [Chrysothrix sp. TS-e1954]|nr:MAG: hypothetical protein M1828_004619 [Chrysothrix sp. TS-e1954]